MTLPERNRDGTTRLRVDRKESRKEREGTRPRKGAKRGNADRLTVAVFYR
jgi:hypothetical protein